MSRTVGAARGGGPGQGAGWQGQRHGDLEDSPAAGEFAAHDKLQIRFEDELASREYLAHPRHYSVPVEPFPNRKISAIEYALTPYKPLGMLPDLPLYFMSMDAWLFGYLIIAIPVTFLLRWMFKVC